MLYDSYFVYCTIDRNLHYSSKPNTLCRLGSARCFHLRPIVTGLIPFFIIAGWIESFITRHADAYPVVGAAAILLSLGGVIGYFVLYPYYLYKNETNGKN